MNLDTMIAESPAMRCCQGRADTNRMPAREDKDTAKVTQTEQRRERTREQQQTRQAPRVGIERSGTSCMQPATSVHDIMHAAWRRGPSFSGQF